MRRLWLLAGIAALVLMLGVAGAMAYASRNTPAPLKLADASPQASASPTPPLPGLENTCVPAASTGTTTVWTVQPGSKAGFRAHENFLEFKFPHEAVARSDRVGGYLVSTSDRRHLLEGCIAVDLRGLTSIDKLPPPLPPASNRDGLFADIFNLRDTPLAFFRPDPMDLPLSKTGQIVHLTFHGDMTIRNATKPVAVRADCRLAGPTLACAGSTTFDAQQFNVLIPGRDSPIQVDPLITVEFSLILA